MPHKEIFNKFKEIYVIDDDDVDCWFPNGKGSVRVRSKVYGEFIFTYWSKKKWRIESVDSWLDSIKVKVK